MDPLTHEFPYISPYNFVENNPVNLVDPDGMKAVQPNRNDEPPINFVGTDKSDIVVRGFNRANNSEYYKKADNFFPVYGHGNVGLISDRKSEPKNLIYDMNELNNTLQEKSAEFCAARENGKEVTVCLLSCLSATEGADGSSSLAQEFSKEFPNDIVIGMDGYTIFSTVDGESMITAVSTERVKDGANNNGSVVVYKAGEEQARYTWQKFTEMHPEYFK